MHQPIPLADLQKRARCNTQLKNHGFCTVEDGESDHEHAIPDLFNAPNKHYNLNNRSSSSQGSSYGRELPSTPSNEDVSTESSRGSSYRHNASALATRGASPHRSAKECPLRRPIPMMKTPSPACGHPAPPAPRRPYSEHGVRRTLDGAIFSNPSPRASPSNKRRYVRTDGLRDRVHRSRDGGPHCWDGGRLGTDRAFGLAHDHQCYIMIILDWRMARWHYV